MGYPTWRRSNAVLRGLRLWMKMLVRQMIREQEEQEDGEEDVDSVLELFPGMC